MYIREYRYKKFYAKIGIEVTAVAMQLTSRRQLCVTIFIITHFQTNRMRLILDALEKREGTMSL